jgi:hypothetical protein
MSTWPNDVALCASYDDADLSRQANLITPMTHKVNSPSHLAASPINPFSSHQASKQESQMNKVVSIVASMAALLLFLSGINAFAPSSIYKNHNQISSAAAAASRPGVLQRPARLDTHHFVNLGERERDALTRESEPEDFFAT